MSAEEREARRARDAYAVLFVGGILSWASTVVGTSDATLTFAAYAAPLIVLVACICALIVLALGGPASFGAPATVLAFALGAYFGFGSLLPVIAPQEYLDFEQEFFAFSRIELIATHRVVAVGMMALAATAWVVLRGLNLRTPVVGRLADAHYLRRSATRMLVIGTTVRLLVTMPYALGLRSGFMAGAMGAFEILAYVGLIFLAYGVASRKLSTSSDRLMLFTFGGINLVLGVLTLSKLNFFFSLAAMMAGFGFGRPKARVFVSMIVLAVLSYAVMKPFVDIGRSLRTDSGSSISTRIARIPTAELIAEALNNEYAKWFAFSRFNYVNSTVFAIRSYDAGQPSRSMTAQLGWVVVPRLLWPDKPNITETGHEVAMLMTGNDATLTGIGIFGEGYWNGGYLGVILGSSFVGFLLGLFEIPRRRALETFDVPGMCLFWYCCLLAFRIDDFFLPTYVGSWPIIFGTYVILAIIFGRAPGWKVDAVTTPRVDTLPRMSPGAV